MLVNVDEFCYLMDFVIIINESKFCTNYSKEVFLTITNALLNCQVKIMKSDNITLELNVLT